MIILDENTSLKIGSGGAGGLTPEVYTSWLDVSTSGIAAPGGRIDQYIPGFLDIIVPAPAAGYHRIVKSIVINELGGSSMSSAIVYLNDGVNDWKIFEGNIPLYHKIQYVDGHGWSFLSPNGEMFRNVTKSDYYTFGPQFLKNPYLDLDTVSTNVTLTNPAYFIYLGVADREVSMGRFLFSVQTAAAGTISGVPQFGIFTNLYGLSSTPAGNQTLTCCGSTLGQASWLTSAGGRRIATVPCNHRKLRAGEDVWFGISVDATTDPVLRGGLQDETQRPVVLYGGTYYPFSGSRFWEALSAYAFIGVPHIAAELF